MIPYSISRWRAAPAAHGQDFCALHTAGARCAHGCRVGPVGPAAFGRWVWATWLLPVYYSSDPGKYLVRESPWTKEVTLKIATAKDERSREK